MNDTITPALPEKYIPSHGVNDVNMGPKPSGPENYHGQEDRQREVGPGTSMRTRRNGNTHVDEGQAPTTWAPP